MALGVPPIIVGRLANFINAELWADQLTCLGVSPSQHKAAQFCPDVIGVCARHPSQLYEALLEGLILGGLLLWLAWRRDAYKLRV